MMVTVTDTKMPEDVVIFKPAQDYYDPLGHREKFGVYGRADDAMIGQEPLTRLLGASRHGSSPRGSLQDVPDERPGVRRHPAERIRFRGVVRQQLGGPRRRARSRTRAACAAALAGLPFSTLLMELRSRPTRWPSSSGSGLGRIRAARTRWPNSS